VKFKIKKKPMANKASNGNSQQKLDYCVDAERSHQFLYKKIELIKRANERPKICIFRMALCKAVFLRGAKSPSSILVEMRKVLDSNI
jgi:hypothetical protein